MPLCALRASAWKAVPGTRHRTRPAHFVRPSGEVRVAVERCGAVVRVAVHDDGPGIPPDDMPHLFEAFWRGRGRDRQGAGLGLWIARTLTEAQGGRIAVTSGEGEGTRVVVELQSGCGR